MMRKKTLFTLLVLLAAACHERARMPTEEDFRASLIRHGFEVGPLTHNVPPPLDSLERGSRREGSCAPATIERHAMDFCVFRFPSLEAAMQWLDDRATDPAWPDGTIKQVSADIVVVVAPKNGALPIPLHQRVTDSLHGLVRR